MSTAAFYLRFKNRMYPLNHARVLNRLALIGTCLLAGYAVSQTDPSPPSVIQTMQPEYGGLPITAHQKQGALREPDLIKSNDGGMDRRTQSVLPIDPSVSFFSQRSRLIATHLAHTV